MSEVGQVMLQLLELEYSIEVHDFRGHNKTPDTRYCVGLGTGDYCYPTRHGATLLQALQEALIAAREYRTE